MAHLKTALAASLALLLLACGGSDDEIKTSLQISELVADNEGVAIDEEGQLEDWLELVNNSDEPLLLSEFSLADSAEEFYPLPDQYLQPGETIVIWADDDENDGANHLPFKLSASGDELILRNAKNEEVDRVSWDSLNPNQAYGRYPSSASRFEKCRYTSPGKPNPERCQPPAVKPISDNIAFETFNANQWPTLTPTALGINELALFPAAFVEFKNFSSATVELSEYRLVLAAYPPTVGLPPYSSPQAIDLPTAQVAPGDVYSFIITSDDVESIANQAHREGIAVLYQRDTQSVADQVPFMRWPDNNALSRASSYPHRFRFCQNSTPNLDDNCTATPSRNVGDRTRGLYTPNDFRALTEGTGQTTVQSLKFLVDLYNDGAVHFASARDWPLHYTFAREVIDGDRPLDRCNSTDNRMFNQGWYEFSVENYSDPVNRRYHLGTLTHHTNANLRNVEFTFGDEITPTQMRDTFYTVTPLMENPFEWSLRPQDDSQIADARQIEGSLPIVGPKAPFEDLVFQGLAPGVAFGTLTFVATDELANQNLGRRTIVITNDVPNDIDFVAGLITEAFQTPLAHVNILSQSRNTPNMALPNASTQPEFANLIGKLVRLEVYEGGYTVREAALSEAQAFWDEQDTQGEILTPRLDGQSRELVDLMDADIEDLPRIGAKAAQMAELYRVNQQVSMCGEGANFAIPDSAFAIPMAHYIEHMNASGAQSYLDQLLADDLFYSDLSYRRVALQSLRQMILEHPVEANLLAEVTQWVSQRFGNKRTRFRSSSNTEDLAEFNGAGLYESISAELDEDDRRVDDAMRTVWASLWNLRAVEERINANVEQSAVAMGILVHPAFLNERANGVAVGRNILTPTRPDQYYFNAQAGEASVTNPAPGVVTEQLIYQWPPRTPRLTYHSFSSLLNNEPVITPEEARALACSVDAIQSHFRDLLDPLYEDRWFTMETEFKFLGEERELLIKQARPYQLGNLDIPNDCREDI